MRDRSRDDRKKVRKALGSASLKRCLSVLDLDADPVDRHFLLMHIVQETYRVRHDSDEIRDLCERVARQHVAEFPGLAEALRKEFESDRLPHVPTFQHLATVLTEKGEYEGAVAICKSAIRFRLSDFTQSGFEGRIERIRKQQQRGTPKKTSEARSAKSKKKKVKKKHRSGSSVPRFEQYNPTTDDLSPRRREFYGRWTAAWRKGEALPVDGNMSYLFLYAYGVLERGPARAKSMLRRLSGAYRTEEPYFAEYCSLWYSDCLAASGEYAKAIDATPILEPSKRAVAQTDRLLSLKLLAGQRISGRDVLTLNGPRVTKWGKEHLDDVLGYLSVIVPAYERENRINLIREWAKKAHSHPLYIFGGSMSSRELPGITAHQFSDCVPACEFVEEFTRDAENTAREETRLPKVGEGWIAETELYYALKQEFADTEVVYHARPEWLGRQHLDIYFPSWGVAVEFQGTQHDEPVAYFGGEEAFKQTQRRDKRKAKLCKEQRVNLIYVRPGYSLEAVERKIRAHAGNR